MVDAHWDLSSADVLVYTTEMNFLVVSIIATKSLLIKCHSSKQKNKSIPRSHSSSCSDSTSETRRLTCAVILSLITRCSGIKSDTSDLTTEK